jgi:hypothetical protein
LRRIGECFVFLIQWGIFSCFRNTCRMSMFDVLNTAVKLSHFLV